MVALTLVVRPLATFAGIAIRQDVLIPGATSLIRLQSHWHVTEPPEEPPPDEIRVESI